LVTTQGHLDFTNHTLNAINQYTLTALNDDRRLIVTVAVGQWAYQISMVDWLSLWRLWGAIVWTPHNSNAGACKIVFVTTR